MNKEEIEVLIDMRNNCLNASVYDDEKRLIKANAITNALMLQERINKAIEYIENHKRKDEFLELNEWGTRDLLEILKGDSNE